MAAAGRSVVRVDGRDRMGASGFVWSADGVIVTAHHVLERDENVSVGLPDGSSVDAKLVGRDPSTDLAVLRVQGGLAAPGLIEPEGLKVGNIVLALGRPGKTVQATLGVVSALGQGWSTRAGGKIDRYLQTDVVMYPGFSGGPLVEASGRIAGLNSSSLSRGVTVSVPVPTIRRVVETLLAHGRVRRAYLGVGAQIARLPVALEKKTGQETGLLVLTVEPGSGAEKAGLMMGDTILALNGRPLRNLDDLLSQLTGESVGSTVPVKVVRGGDLREVKVTVGERQ